MSTLLLSKEERGVVIFHVWKSLAYPIRMTLSIFLILIGFIIQYFSLMLFPGIFFVFAGNLLLLVKGYDGRIKLGTLDFNGEWVKTDKEQLENIVQLNKKAKKWDVSALDITSGLGVFVFILSIIGLIILLNSGIFSSDTISGLLAANIAVLLYPHWFTGVRRITTTPKLLNKIYLFQNLINSLKNNIGNDTIEYLMYVKGKEQKFPSDVKFKMTFKNQPEGFLGLYGQISLNNVQGKDYPYFYVVLVAKPELNMLKNYYNSVTTSRNVIKERSMEDGVEIIIIRQYTTKTSGYHTNSQAVKNIMLDGIKVGRIISSKNR